MNYFNKQNKGQTKVEQLSLLSGVRQGQITVNVQNDVHFPGYTIELFLPISRYFTKCVRTNARYCMKDTTLKFIKRLRIIPEGEIFRYPQRKKSGIDKSSERKWPKSFGNDTIVEKFSLKLP
ncbi:hypothetical protein TNCT_49471 [Trichonephila clavata]|uniref:Uncharacterized protein n=1 Tax=Trichonephila clavata TaxID=2740835 RepID=A0A8X6FX88_TRICU|nr:hypothetical protein TNCT_49471 [Trichonephila clavata]